MLAKLLRLNSYDVYLSRGMYSVSCPYRCCSERRVCF